MKFVVFLVVPELVPHIEQVVAAIFQRSDGIGIDQLEPSLFEAEHVDAGRMQVGVELVVVALPATARQVFYLGAHRREETRFRKLFGKEKVSQLVDGEQDCHIALAQYVA